MRAWLMIAVTVLSISRLEGGHPARAFDPSLARPPAEPLSERTENNIRYVLIVCYRTASRIAVIVPQELRANELTATYLASLVADAIRLAPSLAQGTLSNGYPCAPAPYPSEVYIYQTERTITVNSGYRYRIEHGRIQSSGSLANESFYITGSLITRWEGSVYAVAAPEPAEFSDWRGELVDYLEVAEEESRRGVRPLPPR